MNWFEGITRYRLGAMFPRADITRSPMDDDWLVRIRVNEREIAACYDDERRLRLVDELLPRPSRNKRHWSLQRARRWAPA